MRFSLYQVQQDSIFEVEKSSSFEEKSEISV